MRPDAFTESLRKSLRFAHLYAARVKFDRDLARARLAEERDARAFEDAQRELSPTKPDKWAGVALNQIAAKAATHILLGLPQNPQDKRPLDVTQGRPSLYHREDVDEARAFITAEVREACEECSRRGEDAAEGMAILHEMKTAVERERDGLRKTVADLTVGTRFGVVVSELKRILPLVGSKPTAWTEGEIKRILGLAEGESAT